MKTRLRFIALFLFTSIFLFQCQSGTDKVRKFLASDPFQNTLAPSETFQINAKQDTVIEGEQGTMLVLPKGCFVDASGEVVTEPVSVELTEALTIDRMLLSNLTTTSEGKPLETDGMIYLNATANGKQLKINPSIPIRIEIPTAQRKPGMMAYQGIRDANGNMNWIEPQPLDNYLIPVDIQLLDFLPPGFAKEVEKGMPFRNYTAATPALADSLYYSLAEWKGLSSPDFLATDYNEPYYNSTRKVVDGKYTRDSYIVQKADSSIRREPVSPNKCGISPASIKVIKSPKYQNTLLATREFEARLRVIFTTCNTDILEVYVKNLDKNLYELDSLAARLASDSVHKKAFHQFAQQRLTKIKNGDRYAQLLRGYYDNQLKQVTRELQQNQEEFTKELAKQNRKFEKVVKSYEKVLWKREKHRMETYGFTWTRTGWINIDNGTLPKPYDSYPLEVTLENGTTLDRAYVYVIYPSIKSLYQLNSTDNASFYAGNEETQGMLMPRNETAVAIAVGYKGEQLFLASRTFRTGMDKTLNLNLKAATTRELKQLLHDYDNYSRANQLDVDLKYMQKMYAEKKRQEVLKKEYELMQSLHFVAFPCCNPNGMVLFQNNCSTCHAIDRTVIVGPGLADATSKYSFTWLSKFVKNSSALIASEDPQANKLFKQYNKLQMQSFPDLTDDDIRAIFKYIYEANGKPLK
jgi:cytochrome c551/c552